MHAWAIVSAALLGVIVGAVGVYAVLKTALEDRARERDRARDAAEWWQRQAQSAAAALLDAGARLHPPVPVYDLTDPPFSVDDADRLAVDAMKEQARAAA